MAEGRMLKRRITASKKMAALKTDKARLLWLYLLPFTDVDGRIIADCEDIRDEIIRKQRKGYSLARIEECLQDLYQVGLIVLYSINGTRYLEIARFWDEQSHNRDREAESLIPAPTQGVLTECSHSNPLKLSKVKLSKDKLNKDKYGEFVFLTKEQYQKLVKQFGAKGTEQRIEDLNLGIGSKGYKYNSHYHAILSWDRKNNKDGKPKGRLLPLIGKLCSKEGCKLPAVYKDTSGSYDFFCCSEHLPEKVKKKYG